MVTEQELRNFLKLNGWGFCWRRTGNIRIAYAQKRQGLKVTNKYLIAESKLGDLSESDVLRKISS